MTTLSAMTGGTAGRGLPWGGVYSRITNYDPYVSILRKYSTQYSYIDYGGGGSTFLRASIGWRKVVDPYTGNSTRSTCVHYQASPSTSVFAKQFNLPSGPTAYYTVLHNRNNPGVLTFQVNGGNLWQQSNVQWVPYLGATMGETNDLRSQMPGGWANPATFDDTRIWYNGAWRPFAGTTVWDSRYYGNARVSDTYIGIWDQACQS